MSRVDFRALGNVSVLVDGADRPLRPMERALLAILLANHNRVVGAERLADLLWRGSPPRSSRIALRVHVDRLRQAIQAGEVSRIVFASGGYRAIVEPHELDIIRFETAMSRGRAVRDRHPDAAAILFREALAEWNGTPFDLVDDIPVVDEARAALERRYADLLVCIADAEFAAGQEGTVVADLMRWCVADPYSEPLAAALATALYRTGDQVAALERCRAFRKLLRDELGLTASAEFGRLHDDILNRVLPAPAVSARPAMRVFSSVPGRSREVDDILRIVQRAEAEPALIAITGPRGVGTSAVLAEVHRQLPASVLVRCDPRSPLAALTQLEQALQITVGEANQDPRDVGADLRVQVLCSRLRDAQVTAVLIDDVYAMDPDEAEVFRRVRARLDAALTVITAGRELSAAGNRLVDDTTMLATVYSVGVGPFDSDAARAVVASILRADQIEDADLVSSIVATSKGDAYVLTGLARHVLAGGDLGTAPASIAEFVNRVISGLDPASRHILACASVIGSDLLDLSFIASVCGEPRSVVIEAAEAALMLGVLHDSSRGVEFRHAYFREGAANGLSPLRRADLNRRVAELLIDSGCDDAARIAAHLRAAARFGPTEQGLTWTLREARSLLVAGAPAACAARAAQARDLAVAASAPQHVVIECALLESEACNASGHVGRALDLACIAATQARRAKLHAAFASAAILAAGPMLPSRQEREQAAALTAEALVFTDADASKARIELLEAWVRSRVLIGEPPDAETFAVARELEEVAGAEPSADIACLVHRARYNLSWRIGASSRDRLQISSALVAAAIRADRHAIRLEGLRMQVCDRLEGGDISRVGGALEAYRVQSAGLGSPLHEWWSSVLSVTAADLVGDVAGTLAWRSRAERQAMSVGPESVVLASLERDFADAVRTNDFTALADDSVDVGEVAAEPLVALATTVVARMLGAPASASALRRQVGSFRHGPYAVAAAALVLLGLPDDAAEDERRAVATELIPMLARAQGGLCIINGAGCLGPVDAYLANACLEIGDFAAGARYLQSAHQLVEATAPSWAQWLTDWEVTRCQMEPSNLAASRSS